ncbi:PIG-L deacetylase family protein [Lentibacillus cibarius]|uniref:PIG-L family deacetylase n=1 Tax=Lentibacillus cibarius TaxID=2583219 RepID=A0A5S3QJ59_9BACI|nr:PIG-L family deacetylase [Lentibacillus cibarius]TMN21954.1 PIG-L family deacetylase [Lentibacillus cibarius]
MKAKELLMTILKPINIPLTRLLLRRHYSGSKTLSDTKQAKRVLVLAPHMDDETIGPGGAIRLHANEGADVHCVFVTDGSNSVSELSKEDLMTLRMQEMEQVQDILGINRIHYLGLPDGKVTSNGEAKDKFYEQINSLQPDIIYCPSFIDAHPDHTETAQILADVLKENDMPDITIRLYEINCPIPPDYINCVMDISATLPEKEQAISEFSSQAIAFDGFLELNRLKTNLTNADIQSAEIFFEPSISTFIQHCDNLEIYKDLFPSLFKQANRTDTLLWAIYKNLKRKRELYAQSLQTVRSLNDDSSNLSER